MAYEVDKELPCQDCGTPTYRRMNKTRSPLCIMCAIKHATANTIQLRQHSGPYYEKWRASMSQAFSDEGRGRGTSPN